MNTKIGFVIDPIERLNLEKDSSILLMNAALRNNYDVFWCETPDIHATAGQVWGLWQQYLSSTSQKKHQNFNEFDFIFLREEPPIDQDFINLTYLYDLAQKPIFINPPQALRNVSEKLYPLRFYEYIPDQLITRHNQKILEYLEQHTKLVLKPIGLFGAKGVNCIQKNQQNTMETINQLTQNESNLVVCQKFLPEVYDGDKRIFMIHGEIAGAFTTIPQNEDFRADDSFGAVSMESTITDQEMALCHAIQPKLKEDHLYFIGLDVIGGLITELNVTCVAGIWHMNQIYGISYEDQVLRALLKPFIML